MTLNKISANHRGVAGHQWLRNLLLFLKSEKLRVLDVGHAKAVRSHVIGPLVAAGAARVLVHDYMSLIGQLRVAVACIVRTCAADTRQKQTSGSRHAKFSVTVFYSPTAWNSNNASRIGVIGSP